ncbi:MAG TPA: pyrroloquinoline quinone biosynthesis peptide chaperone PqqD [Candidatus Binataceae bacterium]|nr:pyrroloquinoline quinone biosynthesis peptide chaperone PqqD [Candidatus Binataceae bacterium]
MSDKAKIELEHTPSLAARGRLQFEPAQNATVLLYPEGMIKLSDTAAEILKRVDGKATIGQIIADLEHTYPGAELRNDVLEFFETAYARRWIAIQGW